MTDSMGLSSTAATWHRRRANAHVALSAQCTGEARKHAQRAEFHSVAADALEQDALDETQPVSPPTAQQTPDEGALSSDGP